MFFINLIEGKSGLIKNMKWEKIVVTHMNPMLFMDNSIKRVMLDN